MKPEKKGSKWFCDLNDTEIESILKIDKEAVKDSEQLLFVIESFGNMEAKDILVKAVEALSDNLDDFEKALK